MAAFVLIPGAWLGGWAWKRVVSLLEDQGHEVYPVTLTGMGDRVHLASEDQGIEVAVHDVLNTIKFNDLHKVVIAGHSFAGKVAAAVADRIPDSVQMILYIDAFTPQRTREPQGAGDPSEFGDIGPGQWTIPLTEEIIDIIGPDVQGKDRERLLRLSTPWPIKLATEPIILSEKFDRLKSSYIFCTKGSDAESLDDILHEKFGKLYGKHMLIEAGHWPMITRPDELVEDMLNLVKEK